MPQFSARTTAGDDLVLSNTLQSLSRAGVRYIGVLASDPRDNMFLADRIRHLSPNTIVFTFDNNLLYAHPQYSDAMDGLLVLSSFPLAPESRKWASMLPAPPGRYRRQFSSGFAEGTYFAARELLKRGQKPLPLSAWVAAIGNGSVWPLAAIPDTTYQLGFMSRPARNDLQLALLIGLLVLLAAWFDRTIAPLSRAPRRSDRTHGALIATGLGALWLVAAVLIVIATIPRGDCFCLRFPWLLGLGAIGTALFWLAVPHVRGPLGPARLAALSAAALALLIALSPLLELFWMPGGAELFDLRGYTLSSGLSPVFSLSLLAGSLFAWALLELKRRTLLVQQDVAWPLHPPCEPALRECAEMTAPLEAKLQRTLPAMRRPFWPLLFLLLVPPAAVVWQVIQPVAEPATWGRILLVLVVVALGLSAASFTRFLSVWLELQRILGRLDHSGLQQALRRLSKEVAWQPMRSFGWNMPRFKMLTLSTQKLLAIDSQDRFHLPERREVVETELAKVFTAARAGDVAAEIAARDKLNDIFTTVLTSLATSQDHPAVQDLFAVRTIAYLRQVIAHMRNLLMGSMAPMLLLLAGVRSYAFQPKEFVSFGLWATLSVGVIVTLWVFVQMDRDSTLSAIADTDAGKVTFDRHFVTNLITYGAIPLMGILVSQFPTTGRLLVGWINPALRMIGGG